MAATFISAICTRHESNDLSMPPLPSCVGASGLFYERSNEFDQDDF